LYTRVAANRDVDDLGEVRGILAKLTTEAEGKEEECGTFAHAMDW
jgi:hypothetical protein